MSRKSLSQWQRERADLMKAIRREEKRKDRARLLELRGEVRALARRRTEAIAKARTACKRRGQVPTVREALAVLRAARQQARATCDASLAAAGKLKTETARARAKERAEVAHRATMRRLERQAKERKREERPRLAKARERAQESDDEVRSNLPPELLHLFERVKRQIKATDRMTRTEAFLQYAHDHPDEELAALEDKTDAMIREFQARANPQARTHLQSLLFDRFRFSPGQVLAWTRTHKCEIDGRRVTCRGKQDLSRDYIHVRQRSIAAFVPASMRTIELGRGVSAIVGHLKRGGGSR